MSSIRDWISESIPDVVMEDAAGWMATLDSDRCSPADRLAFARWLDEDAQHRWAFEELSEVWAKLHTLADVAPLLDHPKVTRLPPRARTAPVPAPARDWSALSVSLIIACGVALNVATDVSTETYVTGAGEIVDVDLDDGSRVELNGRTELIVELDERARRLHLTGGEAVFHVAADGRPFTVTTERGVVAATGTSFVVASSADRFEVAVLEGSVSVISNPQTLPLSEYDDASSWRFGSESARLGAGDYVRLSSGSLRMETTNDASFEQMLSWRDGVVEFHDQPLAALVSEMRRYVDLNVHIADPELAGKRISARFATGDAEAYVARLREFEDFKVDQAGPRWVVLRGPPGQ